MRTAARVPCRAVAFLAAALGLAPSLLAQGAAPPDLVATWLEADRPAELQRGIWHAGASGLARFVPRLLELLERSSARAPGAELGTRRLLLDALIRLDAPVPPAQLLARLDEELLPQTTILLARSPGADDALVALLAAGAPDGAHRMAAAGVLAQRAPARVVPWLVARLRVRLAVTVRAPGSEERVELRSGAGGGRWSVSHAAELPRVSYVLSFDDPEAAGRGLAEAPLRVTWRRDAGRKRGSTSAPVSEERAAELAARILGRLAARQDLGLRLAERTLVHDWTGPAAYERALRAEAEAIARDRARLLAALRARGLVPEDGPVDARPKIVLEVIDVRPSRGPIPDVPLR